MMESTHPARRASRVRRCTCAALVATLVATGAASAQVQTPPGILPLEDFSPVFLGMYRKVMEIEDQIRTYSARYDVDFDLARAVCLYESGGNAALSSGAGARGYFQVMPATFRELRVETNIEAGVKYLSQMIRRFEREDRAIAAYNAGPGRVGRAGGLPLETLQYVLGVGHYRGVLKRFDASLRYHAAGISLTTVRAGEDWSGVSSRIGTPEWELRLHNPFLAQRQLRAGQLIAYPVEPRDDLFRIVDGDAEYRLRHGDNYLKLAFTLGIEPDAMRSANGLWQIQAVPAGVAIRIPLGADSSSMLHSALGMSPDAVPAAAAPAAAAIARTVSTPAPVEPAVARKVSRPAAAPTTHRVQRGETLGRLADRYGTTIRAIQSANDMGRRSQIRIGERLRIPGAGDVERASARAASVTHRVRRGETLTGIAERYGITIGAIQRANRMGRRTTIRTGERLQIPS